MPKKYRVIVEDGYGRAIKGYYDTLKKAENKVKTLPEGAYDAYVEEQTGRIRGNRLDWVEA